MINLYRSPQYAHCFAEDFIPREIECAQGWALERPIAPTEYTDFMGPYPLWYGENATKSQMVDCLRAHNAVSFVGVVLEGRQPKDWDYLAPFKTHYVTDLRQRSPISKHHQYEVRRAQRGGVDAKIVPLQKHIEDWIYLYARLVERHDMQGLTAFSPTYFQRLALCPEVVTFAAFHNQELLAMHVFAMTDDTLTSHLAASADRGYEMGAMYGVNATALAWAQAQGYRAVNWGGCAGSQDQLDGLAKFKQGFSTTTQQSYIAGVIGLPEVYTQLCAAKTALNQPIFFPRYRR
jgi:hypothetical protein